MDKLDKIINLLEEIKELLVESEPEDFADADVGDQIFEELIRLMNSFQVDMNNPDGIEIIIHPNQAAHIKEFFKSTDAVDYMGSIVHSTDNGIHVRGYPIAPVQWIRPSHVLIISENAHRMFDLESGELITEWSN